MRPLHSWEILVKVLFPQVVPFGPYDTNTQQPCTNISSPTCTYTICTTQTQPAGYLCQTGGKCNPTFQTTPPPPFRTLADCVACQANRNCGANTCCPQSQQPGGVCPSTPPPPPPSTAPSFVVQAIIGLIIFVIFLVIMFFIVRTINRRIQS